MQRNLILLLAPFAPYLAHELWETLGERSNLLRAPWPKYDPALAKEEEVEIPVQVNGKLRGRVRVPADADQALVEQRALADEKIKAAIAGKKIVKKILRPRQTAQPGRPKVAPAKVALPSRRLSGSLP